MMTVRWSVEARDDLREAAAYYDMQLAGLGLELARMVRVAESAFAEHPNAWRQLDKTVRRYRLNRFPYGVYYVVEAETITIIAVAHLHRKPGHWRGRT